MQKSTSFISKACYWWLAGLSLPWSAEAAKKATKRTVLSYSDDGVFLDQSEQLIDGVRLKVLANKTEICLLVPSNLAMSRSLTEQQKGLPLSTVAEQLLPFSASELVYVLDDETQTVHVAVADDMRGPYEALLSHRVSLGGLAFLDQDRLCVSNELGSLLGDLATDGSAKQANSKLKSGQGRALILAFTPLLLCLVASAFSNYWVAEQKQELSRLESARSDLVGDIPATGAHSFLNIETLFSRLSHRKAEALSAETLREDLSMMARNISESTEISQLIITPAELILDASASSGSELQTQLDQSTLFASTEFVSSISQSRDGESERFRLKLQRKSDQAREAR